MLHTYILFVFVFEKTREFYKGFSVCHTCQGNKGNISRDFTQGNFSYKIVHKVDQS
jgi:hypothetical protein